MSLVDGLLLIALSVLGGVCSIQIAHDPDEPLLLTPYILDGRLSEGRKAAKVPPMVDGVVSYSGYLTVDRVKRKNTFFWYFPAELGADESTALIAWLQGGPGTTSMLGLFYENGPMYFDVQGHLRRRNHRWTKAHHLVYFDNPVGTGFSFCPPGGRAGSSQEIATDIHRAIVQFLKLFPNLSKVDLILAGESYAGVYLPLIGSHIHRANQQQGFFKVNLKGISIGDGIVDPQFMVYGTYMANLGLISMDQVPEMLKNESKYKEAVLSGNYTQASQFDEYSNMDFFNQLDKNHVSVYNFLNQRREEQDFCAQLDDFFRGIHVRRQIHVGVKSSFSCMNYDVQAEITKGDGYIFVSPTVTELLENYRIMYYVGQLDVVVHYPMTAEFVNSLRWSGSTKYRQSSRDMWFVRGHLAGFVRRGGNLTLALVRNAGHSVPIEQPEWAYELVTSFIRDDIDSLTEPPNDSTDDRNPAVQVYLSFSIITLLFLAHIH